MMLHPAVRFTGRLRRCRNCGIRVRREGMVYGGRACSEDCADELWIQAEERKRNKKVLSNPES